METKTNKRLFIECRLGTLFLLFFLFFFFVILAYLTGIMFGRSKQYASLNSEQATVIDHKTEQQGSVLDLSSLGFAKILRTKPNSNETESSEAITAVTTKPTTLDNQAEEKFEYFFQVAAFKDLERTDKLRQTLEMRGYRVSIEQKGNLFLVQILLKCNAEQLANFQDDMQTLRLGDPIIISKKPI